MNQIDLIRCIEAAKRESESARPTEAAEVERLFRSSLSAIVPERTTVDFALMCIADIDGLRNLFTPSGQLGSPHVLLAWDPIERALRSLLNAFADALSRDRMRAIAQELDQ